MVRGLAPNMTLAALAASSPRTGYFVIDPAEDCAQMADLRQLLTSWSDGQARFRGVSAARAWRQSWHGHTGQLPEPGFVSWTPSMAMN